MVRRTEKTLEYLGDMTSVANKQLPLKYDNISQLLNAADQNIPKKESIRCKNLYDVAARLYQEAELARRNNDLENAFVYYFRFGSLAVHLKKAPDYSERDHKVLSKIVNALTEAELIRDQLTKLYEERCLRNANNTEEKPVELQSQQLTAPQLQEILEQSKRYLVIDLRDEESFRESHLDTKFIFNLPARFLRPSAQLDEVLQDLDGFPFFAERHAFDHVILMDGDSRNPLHAGVPDNHPIKILNSLLIGDREKKLKKAPFILSGGYRLWLVSYPHKTTNPNPHKPDALSNIPIGNDVMYPSLDSPAPSAPPFERFQKPNRPPTSSNEKPQINRSDKSLVDRPDKSLVDRPDNSSSLKRSQKPQAPPSSLKPISDSQSNAEIDGLKSKTCGLKNLGNTCYMNSTLQCVAHTTFFSAYFLTGAYKKDLNRDSAHGSKGKLPEVLEQLFCDMYHQTYNNALMKFNTLMGSLFSAYNTKQQQDAHEFLLDLLNTLHDDLNRAPQRNMKNSSKPSNISENNVEIALNHFFSQHKDQHSSVVSDTFEGILMSQLECATCKNSSYTFEVFSVLSLPIPQTSGSVTLDDCFREFFKVESLEDQIWDCPHCKTKRNAEKHLRIARLPKALVIQFVRFKHDKGYYGSEKISQYVDFRDIINVDKHLDKKTQPKSKSYSLFGFVNHTGNLAAGHYTAYCRSTRDKWHKYDDSVVTAVGVPNETEKKSTYIAFYMSS